MFFFVQVNYSSSLETTHSLTNTPQPHMQFSVNGIGPFQKLFVEILKIPFMYL